MRLTWFFFKERLLLIESKFKALGAKSALLKKGDGCSGDDKEDNYLEECDTLAIDLDPTIEDTDQRNKSVIKKDTILPKTSNVSLVPTEKKADNSKSPEISDIVSSVRKRFQKRARLLLMKLFLNPNFSVNNLGEVTIDGVLYKHSDINILIQNCFYKTKYEKNVIGLPAWFVFLKANDLFNGYVTSPDKLFEEANASKPFWYLGPLIKPL